MKVDFKAFSACRELGSKRPMEMVSSKSNVTGFSTTGRKNATMIAILITITS